MEKVFINAFHLGQEAKIILTIIFNNKLQQVGITSMMIMPSQMFQESNRTSKSEDHVEKLIRRLQLWREGFDVLVREVRFIRSKNKTVTLKHTAKKFNDFMITGKMNAALRLLLEIVSPRIIPINNDLLKEKHPDGAMKLDDLLLHGTEEFLGNTLMKELTVPYS